MAGSLAPFIGADGAATGVVISFQDLTERLEIENLSYRDPMTGVYNRRFFEEELQRVRTPENLPIALIIADIDGLKTANDTWGHHIGDRVIIKTAQTIQSALRQDDVVARIGGDEFAVILRNTPLEAAEMVVRRIMKKCADTIVDGQSLSCSFGCAEMTNAAEDMSEVFARADRAMYQEKARRNKQGRT